MDVVTIGETMVLFNPQQNGPLKHVHQFEKTIAGSESNVAIALSRLGHETGWISRLGDDEFGRYVRNTIRGEGVDTSQVIMDHRWQTGVFFKERNRLQDSKIYYYRHDSAATTMTPDDLDEAYLSRAKILHITGITPALSDSCAKTIEQAIKVAKKHGLMVTFDPNIRLKLWSPEKARDTLSRLAESVDIILPGIEEGELISGEIGEENVAQYFLAKGLQAVVIKLGENGAYFATERIRRHVSGYKVERIVDTVGAGDAFAAGFLSGILQGLSLSSAVALGNQLGALALQSAGDFEGLPYKHELDVRDQILR